MNFPIFPLPLFLLPEGITRLRIFEQRYLNMVKEVSQSDGFVILPENIESTTASSLWGSQVSIINFDQGADGLLVIDVKCQQLVAVDNILQGKDKLYRADTKAFTHWYSNMHDDVTKALSRSLSKIFEQSSTFQQLYHDGFIDEANWVVARWLELLPIQLKDKHMFVKPDSFEQAKELISNIILK